MNLESKTAEETAAAGTAAASPVPLLAAIVVGALLLVAFTPILTGMVRTWFSEPANMEHGVLVLPAAGLMAWKRHAKLAQVQRSKTSWGLTLVLWGTIQAVLGVAAHWIWVSRSAFIISLAGCIASLWGKQMLRELAYPLCTLILMIPPPSFLYDLLTLNLQLLAGRLGADCLETLGYAVLREGNVIEMVGITLSVAEACSGLRSLFSILFLCVVYGYFFVRGNVIRTLIVVIALPIAIVGNVLRIVATGIAGQYNPKLTYGMAHEAFGYISVLGAAIACIAIHMLILRVHKRGALD